MTEPRTTPPAFDWIAHYASTTPDAIALHDLAASRSLTYAQLNTRVAQGTGLLRARGIIKGDRVAFLCHNTSDILEILFACWRIGAICTALNFRLTAPELRTIVQDCSPKLLFVGSELVQTAQSATDIPIIETDGLGGNTPYEQALANAHPIHSFTAQTFDDPCLLLYSSGTTGQPKGIPLTHGNLFHASAATAPRLGTGPHSIAFAALPLFHIGALGTCVLPILMAGGTSVILRHFDPEKALHTINRADLGINTLFFVPATLNALRNHPRAEHTDFSRITLAITGGETVPQDLLEWFQSRGVPLREGWAMTETAGSAVMLDPSPENAKRGAAGKPFPGLRIRIADENGKPVAPNTQGELQIQGPQIMRAYWNRPETTKSAFIDGWFRTGDIGRIDEDGDLFIEDRLKDMYITGGENVVPAEVENVLYQLPQITQAAVIGVPDPKWGETGVACVVLKPDTDLTLSDMTAHCAAQLARYKCPSHLVIMDDLPRSATGKTLKFKLRDHLQNRIERL